jgi:type I restriction enzyme R subunit
MSFLNESTVEDAALEYLRQLGFTTAFGPEMAPDG